MSYLKPIDVFGVADSEHLCMIDDCIFNKDAICSQGFFSLSEQCDKIRTVPSTKRIDPMEQLFDYENGIDQLKFAIDCVESKTAVNCSRYFYEMLLLDYLVCNEDRHLYNFGVLQIEGSTAVAPLFDFGLGLFEHDNAYFGKSVEEAERIALKKSFGNQLPLIEWLEKKYNFKRPTAVDLNDFIFPSKLAEEWLHRSLTMLEIKVKE